MRLLGYADRLSAQEGDVVRFMVSAEAGPYTAQLVRLGGVEVSGKVREDAVASKIDGVHDGRPQRIVTGSHAFAEFAERLTSFGLQLWLQPTAIARGRQTVLHAAPDGWELAVTEAGALELTLTAGGERVAGVMSPVALVDGAWLFVAAGYDAATARLRLDCARLGRWEQDRETARAEEPVEVAWSGAIDGVTIAGPACFNGRVEAPRILRRPLTDEEAAALADGTDPLTPEDLVCAWDFSLGISSRTITDVSGNERHGRLVNLPTRAVLGHRWSGERMSHAEDPAEWSAIHFHDDDLEDAGWDADFAFTIPADLPSGIYAARLEQGGGVEHIPFYVRPRRSRAEVLLLAPTNVYLAYGNERLAAGERGEALSLSKSEPLELNDTDRYLFAHPELGSSLYDVHADGTGVVFASRLRPLVNMRPNYETWLNGGRRHFAADFFITGWLEAKGIAFDVATEEDLHHEGLELLRQYRVVLTGSHPEYPSARELDALEAYLAGGGRLMYLGGNGFYWVTAFDPDHGHAIECRRGFAGFRNWTSHPAEVGLAFTGEMGGTWRHRGRPPQSLVGVGMYAAGFGPASPYVRTPQSFDADVAFVFDGIGDDEPIGDFGLVLGGAAGDELDRTDPELGTPRHAKVLAVSALHTDHYWPAIETQMEITPHLSGASNPEIRAELVLFDTAEGGRVFSTGSICWAASMAYANYDNNVSRVTENVLRAFLA